ncbi:hypothetical protein E3C22_05520 [Jiella endophytica]|uniref:Uncharacterized protein n=1 Tax=Jiella endophytica TaxID=2558362 RepID=A0A4Y8RMH5_9HYPH|nr:hypothetical protein [Jiella endophytica]TFF24852.1 hypothetical protein E3C22_05520 [Jiella endophytica]
MAERDYNRDPRPQQSRGWWMICLIVVVAVVAFVIYEVRNGSETPGPAPQMGTVPPSGTPQ